jgi:hypothetical protein
MPWQKKLVLVIPGFLAGCVTDGARWVHIDNAADIPKGAIPAPTGSYVNNIVNIQASKAEADDFVIYKHEWFMGGTELGDYGRYHMDLMIKRLPEVPFPIMVQASGDAAVNETRRQMVVYYLAMAGVPAPESRVVIGFPEAEGLYGEEAERIYQQMIGGRQTGGFGAQQEFGPFNNRNNPFGGFRGGFRGGLGGGFLGF